MRVQRRISLRITKNKIGLVVLLLIFFALVAISLIFDWGESFFAIVETVNSKGLTAIPVINLMLLATVIVFLLGLWRDRQRQLANVERLLTRLEESSRVKADFVASMSHELRTPLNSIIGFSELIRDEALGKVSFEIKDVVNDIFESGRHLLDLINGILDYSKIESNKLEFSISDFDLIPVIEKTVKTMRPLITKKQQRVVWDAPQEFPYVSADSGKLEQALLNLLSNANKFTQREGEIRVSVQVIEGWAQMGIQDNGVGIEPEDQTKVFDPFVQAEQSTDDVQRGTGLGLQLSKKFVEGMGGMIWLESDYGKGSTFHIAIPLSVRPRGS
jgi:signal transduction histidine kinase